MAGVNICPKKSETVCPEIWGILKLSGLINQKIFETVHQHFLITVASNFLSDTQVNIFQAMLKNIINSHCAFNIMEVCV